MSLVSHHFYLSTSTMGILTESTWISLDLVWYPK